MNKTQLHQKIDAVVFENVRGEITAPALNELLDEIVNGDNLIAGTWAAVKALRDGGKLIPGAYYRITDYVATATQEGTRSAGHPFDVIIPALDAGTLGEDGYALPHKGDTYFTGHGAHPEGWRLKYCLDNDAARFLWADAENGKGVIYRLTDEWGNSAPYDFKGIQILRNAAWWAENDARVALDEKLFGSADAEDRWMYLFTWITEDDEIQDASVTAQIIPNDEGQYSGVYANTFDDVSAYDIGLSPEDPTRPTFAIAGNVLAQSWYAESDNFFYGYSDNTFGGYVAKNTFGGYVADNTFGGSVTRNTFGGYMARNTFGGFVADNTFGRDVSRNTFGGDVAKNTFGGDVADNTFGGYVVNNTFGGYVASNTFGGDVADNTFGGYVVNNTFGGYVADNTFGGDVARNTFGGDVADNTATFPMRYCTIEGGVRNLSFALNGGAEMVGVRTSGAMRKSSKTTVTVAGAAANASTFYEQVVTADRNGNIVVLVPADA